MNQQNKTKQTKKQMQLTKNFHLSELTKSPKASSLGIPNNPNENEIKRLKLLCEKVLQPVRDHFNKPVIITSGFRSKELNSAIGGSKKECLKSPQGEVLHRLLLAETTDFVSEDLAFD